MSRLWVLGIVASLTAGCAGGSTTTLDPTSASVPEPRGPARVSEVEGGIQGVVLDASFLPLANVTVALRGSGADGHELSNMTTLDDGAFAFDLLAPTTYRVTASAAGYTNSSQLAVVVAGEVTSVRLAMDEVARQEPYTHLMIEAGLISCGVAAVLVSAVCVPQYTQPVFGPFKVAIFYPIPAGHRAVVSETDWQNRQQIMRNWYMHDETRDTNFEGDWLGDSIGPAVMRKEFRPGVVPSTFVVPPGAERVPFPPSEQNFTFMTATYYDGNYQREINSTGSAVCSMNPILGFCSGIGVAIQMRFTGYVTVFVHDAPDSLATYSAIPDQ